MRKSRAQPLGATPAGRRALALGVLDQSPVRCGHSPAEAIRETVELAQAAERLGYRRYWVAEHHASEAFAGSAPEILVASLARATSRMRIGTGGVMLNHYSPLKVAEVFRVLEALHPGRIDMGIGRAPGGGSPVALALRHRPASPDVDQFPDQVAELLATLGNDGPQGRGRPGLLAQPRSSSMPDPWMLGSSPHGAAVAARFGCAFSFAHFINGEDGPEAMRAYRRDFRPSAWLASPRASVCAFVLCADTEAEARRLALSRDLWGLRISRQEPEPFPSVTEAEAHTYTRRDRHLVEAGRRSRIVGAPEQVRERLLALAEDYDVEEALVLTVCFDPAARRRSYQLLSEAFDLQRGQDTPGHDRSERSAMGLAVAG